MSRRATRRVRAVVAAAGLALAAASCSGDGEASTTTTVAVSTAAVTEAQAFDLQARAVARAWPESDVCISEESAPAGLRAALEARFGEVTYVEIVDGLASVGWDVCTLVTPSLVGSYRADVVGVDVWVLSGPLEGSAATYLFRWEGSTWIDATPEETGVTVTSSVS